MTVVNPAEILWTAAKRSLADQVKESVWLTCFADTNGLYLDENCLTISVPNSFVRDRIDQRYRDLVLGALEDAGQPGLSLEIRIADPDPIEQNLTFDDDLERLASDAIGTPSDPLSPPLSPASSTVSSSSGIGPTGVANGTSPSPLPTPDGPEVGSGDRPSNLNTKYTFESFVTGPSNRFAQAAALSVAETPARSYNPLFVYGAAGLGKTHLLQAIAHYVNQNYPAYRVRYISTETLLNEFIDAIRHNKQAEFKRRYREIDVLLVDDVQFMEGKDQLQEEFFHTFNTLHQANRQIVLSSDRPPDAVATLEDRLRSRFKWGLVTDIQPPDFETRLAILRKKAEQGNVAIPSSVLEFIVEHVTNNIRELEGALNRVTAYAALHQTDLTIEDAQRVLGDIVKSNQRQITPDLIMETAAARFGFTVEELRAQDRRRPLVMARQIAMYLFRELTELSYPEIAKQFGGRDHTTIIYGFDKIKALMKERHSVYDDVTSLINEIKGG
ncbi:MAG: chromosomal replication initiator protein DnaA [Microthrixaceae bacterium]|nr:chromosomal replication initiator protein DnaA [Microthrixaceae bacterium]MCO5311511.1 chromosomal replication initiator protein DnaA [Microthrixaceae bacterium]